MGLFSAALKTVAYGSAAGTGSWLWLTRNSKVVPLAATDPIFSSPAYTQFNPNRNPATQDICIKRIPLSRIRPRLLEKEGALVEAFTAGLWGGPGFAPQRAMLARSNQSPATAHQLWSRAALAASTYPLGTQIADHFEVVAKTPDAITVRCGDSPLTRGVRASDGLFALGARVLRDEGVVELSMKSVFYKGLGTAETAPMPVHIEFLHRLYTKFWMETASRALLA